MINTKQLRQLRCNGAYDIRKQQDSGMVLSICLMIAFTIIIGILIK